MRFIKPIQNLALSLIVAFILILPVHAQPLKGTLVKQPFINKAGKTAETVDDYYLHTNSKKYFIKFCESTITQQQIDPFTNQIITVDVKLAQGAWDACGPEEAQSRIGEYITILKIIP